MSMVVTFSGETAEEIRDKVANFAKVFGVEVEERQLKLELVPTHPNGRPKAVPFDPGAEPTQDETPPEPAKKRGRPKKTEVASTETVQAPPAAEPPMAETAKPLTTETPAAEKVTKDELNVLFRKLIGEKGINEARSLLQTFGATRISELAEGKYGEVAAKVNQALAG